MTHPAIIVMKQLLTKEYWSRPNTVEFICFMNKLVILLELTALLKQLYCVV